MWREYNNVVATIMAVKENGTSDAESDGQRAAVAQHIGLAERVRYFDSVSDSFAR